MAGFVFIIDVLKGTGKIFASKNSPHIFREDILNVLTCIVK